MIFFIITNKLFKKWNEVTIRKLKYIYSKIIML